MLLDITTYLIISLLINPIVGFSLVRALQKGGLQRVDLNRRPSGYEPAFLLSERLASPVCQSIIPVQTLFFHFVLSALSGRAL